MLDTVTRIVVALLGVHIIAKFVVFLAPYRRRRTALDKGYGDKPAASSTPDVVTMVLTVAIAGLLLWRGVHAVSFLGGLWIGATLIQLYFHNFHLPVAPERAAPPPTSPLKQMSYAIQDSPWRAWPQMVVLVALAAYSLIAMA